MIVVDCAAVVDALTTLDGTEDLRALMVAEELHCPALLDIEIVAALRGLLLRGHITLARAEDVLTDFEDLPLRRWEVGDTLRRRALSLRKGLTAYDASYVALAEALQCRLVTRDQRLARSIGHTAEIVVL